MRKYVCSIYEEDLERLFDEGKFIESFDEETAAEDYMKEYFFYEGEQEVEVFVRDLETEKKYKITVTPDFDIYWYVNSVEKIND